MNILYKLKMYYKLYQKMQIEIYKIKYYLNNRN